MTEEERKAGRIAIAKDVLEHLDKLNVRQGRYIDSADSFDMEEINELNIDVFENKCQVCALGACMLSYVRLYDNVDLSLWLDGIDPKYKYTELRRNEIYPILEKYFDDKQLFLIENAFETICINCSMVRDNNIYYAAANKYFSNKLTPEERLKKIMENIIANDGTFVVEESVKEQE